MPTTGSRTSITPASTMPIACAIRITTKAMAPIAGAFPRATRSRAILRFACQRHRHVAPPPHFRVSLTLQTRRWPRCAFLRRSRRQGVGRFGFVDGFCEQDNWYTDTFLAISQGPIVAMIENYRSGLLWNIVHEHTRDKDRLEEARLSLPAIGVSSRERVRQMDRHPTPLRRRSNARLHLCDRSRQGATGVRPENRPAARLDPGVARARLL